MKLALILLAVCLTGLPALPRAHCRVSVQGQSLPISSTEVAEQHGLILVALSRGELDSGIARLEKLKDDPHAAAIVDRIEIDIARARLLRELRDKHITELVAKGKRVSLELQGEKVTAQVSHYAEGRLTLTGAKTGQAPIAADELLLLPLVRSFSPGVLEGADPAARGYAFVLAGDAKGIATLKGSSDADLLRSQAESVYRPALELGRAAELLTRLAARSAPADVAAATEIVRDLEQLMGSFSGLEVVAIRRPALAVLGSASYPLLFEPSKLTEGLSAKVEKTPDGTVRLTYDFAKTRETRDFIADHGYLEDVRSRYPWANTPVKDLKVEGGVLKLSGSALWRHTLEFVGKASVTVTYCYDRVDDAPILALGVFDDRASSLVGFDVGGVLWVRDIPSRLIHKSPRVPEVRFAARQQLISTLTVANGVASAHMDRKEVAKIDVGSRSRGGVCLIVSGKHDIWVSKVVVEGQVDAESLRARWVDQKIASLGLR